MATRPQRRTSARGRRRRDLIVDAAGELLTTEGFSGLSHRSVARHAGLPLSATTYYFSSLDALLSTAVRHVAAQWVAAAETTLDALPESLEGEQLARALVTVAALSSDAGDGEALSFYERYLEAARRPHLQAIVAEYDAEIEALIGATLRRSTTAAADHARLVLAVIDGALIRSYAEGLPPASAVAPVLDVLRLLGAPPGP